MRRRTKGEVRIAKTAIATSHFPFALVPLRPSHFGVCCSLRVRQSFSHVHDHAALPWVRGAGFA
jgi:hypothetical protein